MNFSIRCVVFRDDPRLLLSVDASTLPSNGKLVRPTVRTPVHGSATPLKKAISNADRRSRADAASITLACQLADGNPRLDRIPCRILRAFVWSVARRLGRSVNAV